MGVKNTVTSFNYDELLLLHTVCSRTRITTCTNGGLQIPVENAEYGVFFGVYCGTILASVDNAATAKVIPGRAGAFNFRHYAGATQDTLAGFSIDATQVPC